MKGYGIYGKDEGWGEMAAVSVEDGERFVGGSWYWLRLGLGLGGKVDVDGSGALGVALAQLEDAWG